MDPVFLIGAERSGTTLLRLMLNEHPQISWLNEFEYAVDQISCQNGWPDVNDYLKWLATHRIFKDTGFQLDSSLSYPELVESFLSQNQNRDDKKIIGATCHRHYDKLLRLFPQARFVYLLRDPRDVARSNVGMGWAGNVWSGVDRWIEAEKLWKRVKRELAKDVYIEIKFEDVIASPEDILAQICMFIKLNYDDRMMTYTEHTSYSKPDPSLTNQWQRKLSVSEIGLVEYKTEELMLDRGYRLASKNVTSPSLLKQLFLGFQNKYYTISFRIKRFGVLLFGSDFLARKLRLKTWESNLKLKMNAIERKHLK